MTGVPLRARASGHARESVAPVEAAADRSRAAQDRGAGASERTQAGLDRDTALADRGAGASERTEAGLDRHTALADRWASAKERERSSHDGLTGAYLPAAARWSSNVTSRGPGGPDSHLSLAFVDVDGLKAINDSRGHRVGDRVLLGVADALRSVLRSHDLIIRYGGDEFACVIEGLNAAAATQRLALVNAALATAADPASVTSGWPNCNGPIRQRTCWIEPTPRCTADARNGNTPSPLTLELSSGHPSERPAAAGGQQLHRRLFK